MRIIKKYCLLILALSALMLVRCVGFEPVVLSPQSNKSKYSLEAATGSDRIVVIDNPKLTDGVFEDFKKELSGWWGDGSIIKFSKSEDLLKVEVNKSSAGYPQFGVTFEPKDFTNTPVVRIRMRTEGGEAPQVRLDLRDVNDMQTNATLVMNDVAVSDQYTEYYFDFNNKFKQSWPAPGIVDPRQISGMTIFINPGDKPFKGTIYIDEIYVMANKDGSGIVSKEYVLDDFSGDINYWWGCDKEKVLLSKADGNSLKVKFKNGQWSCFGMSFDPIDVSATPVIKLRMRIEDTDKAEAVDMVPWFTDVNNKTTNKEHLARKIVIGLDYTDYFFDYTEKLLSKDGDFNSKEINSVIVFLNTLGGPSFNGDVYVDEVSFLPAVPDYVSKRISISKPLFIDPSWPKGKESYAIADFKSDIANWKADDDKILISPNENGSLNVSFKGIGPDWESFSQTISSVNFIDKPVLKIRLKAEGNSAPYLRLILTDNFGNTTNGRPAEEKIEVKNGFADYYFDFTGRFQQRFPTMENVNPGSIQKATFYLNGGLEAYTGSLVIESMQTLTVQEYLRVAR